MLMLLGHSETEGYSGQERGPWGREYRRDLVTSNRSMGFLSFPAGTCYLHRLPCSKEAKLQYFIWYFGHVQNSIQIKKSLKKRTKETVTMSP